MNNFWTYLSRGTSSTAGRAIESSLYKEDSNLAELHAVLVPDRDTLYKVYCTEQLLQTVLTSSFKDELLSDDPTNTYEYPILTEVIEDTYTAVSSYSGVEVLITNEKSGSASWMQRNFTVAVEPASSYVSVTYEGITNIYELTMTDNLSNKLLLSDGIYLRIRGTLPASSFIIGVSYTNAFRRTLNNILNKVDTISIPWYNETYRDAYRTTDFPVKKVATLAMNLYRFLKDVD